MRINGLKPGNRFKGAGVTEASAWGMNHIGLFPLGKKGLEGTIPLFKDNDLSYGASSFNLHLPALSLGGTLGRHGPGNLAKWKIICVPCTGDLRRCHVYQVRCSYQNHFGISPAPSQLLPGPGGRGDKV